jgi:hypothetical protein
MTRSAIGCAALLLVLFALPAVAPAGPLNLRRIPAEAEGVGHIDVEALRKTAIYRLAWNKAVSKNGMLDVDPKLRPLVEALVQSARGVSFWISKGDTGAFIVELSDGKTFDALLSKLPHRTGRVAGQVTRALDGDSDGKPDATTAVVGNLLVVADDPKSLTRTLQVVSGKARSLRKLPAGSTGRGVFFFAALGDKLLDRVRKQARSQALQVDMTAMTIEVSEVSAELRARVRAVMSSAEAAQKIRSVVDGLLALGSLMDDAGKLKPLLDRVTVAASGSSVELRVSIPSAKLFELAESAR